ncbi:phosphoadenosine phosphosulfate reductase family protein [Desulfobacter sp.]|uniref:phosphoadenosine phosphosulfate reductase family protein n=1 Tax=Desulfobacter sp. TaxID=2294 RepID=UPI003D0FDE95
MIKDAAGNTPAPLTNYERKWRDKIRTGDLNQGYNLLQKRQAMPLKGKIELSLERIKEWYEAFGGQVAVSYSGGKDSSVLLHLARKRYPDLPAVFCNTGLEYPEILHLVKRTPNVTVLRPKTPFHRVVKDSGWPIISKKTARGLNVLRNPTGHNQNIWRLYDQGINRFGQQCNGFKVAQRWRFLVDAPFKISDKCCQIMKKDPMAKYECETGRMQMVGMMAADSKAREKIYLQTGCNAYDAKHPRSMPLGFWTEQDIIQALKMFNIPYAKVYGDILQNRSTGQFYFNGVRSTGCVFCCFGLHMEDKPNRFQQLRISHPKLYKFCMEKLGLSNVLDYIIENCPDRKVASKFEYGKFIKQEQLELF